MSGPAAVRDDRLGRRRLTIFRNFSFLTIGKVLGDVVTFVLFVLISRLFGQEGVGQYSFAIAFTGIFAVLSELGTNVFTIREAAHAGEDIRSLFGRVLSVRLALVATVSALFLAGLPFLPFPRETVFIVLLIAGYQISYQLIMLFAGLFLAHDRSFLAGALEGGFKAATGAVAIVAALLGGNLYLTLGSLPLVSLVVVVAACSLAVKHFGRPRLGGRSAELVQTGRRALPYGLYTLFVQVQQRLDVTLIGFLIGAAAAGVYNVAYRAVFMLLFVPHFLGMSLLPVASRLHGVSIEQLRGLYRRSLNLAVLIGFPVAAGLSLIARDLTVLLFGAEFLDSVPLLRILAWLFLLACPRVLIGMFLTACDRQRDRTRAQGWAVLLALVLYAVLIPTYGLTGAAMAALATELFIIVFSAAYLRRVLGWPRVTSRLLIATTATAAFFVPFTLFPSQPLLLVVVASVLMYPAALLLFPQIRTEELRIAIKLVAAGGG